jgi:lycopene cyclase domain-containing protein
MKFEYFILLAVCFAGPMLLSFSGKIKFYQNKSRLVYAVTIPLVFFVIWDVIATYRGHWSFNEKYITGLYFLNLPIEEVLFFIVIPFCALFTWEVVKFYSKSKQ